MIPRIHLNRSATRVALKVFDSVVEASGVTVVVSFTLSSQEQFGEYQLIVSNNVMPAARRTVEFVPEGTLSFYTYRNCTHVRVISRLVNCINMYCQNHDQVFTYSLRISDVPSPPVLVEIHNIGPHSVTISWSEGFHGGSDQTVYYEISSDNTTWMIFPMGTIGISETKTIRNAAVNNLMGTTIYYIRLYSTNSHGRSEMTEHLYNHRYSTVLIGTSYLRFQLQSMCLHI